MRKKWMYFLMLATLVVPLVLSACGATPEPAPETQATAAPQPTAVTEATTAPEPTSAPAAPAGAYEDVDPTGAQVLWWHQHTQERQTGLDQMVADFNASNEWGIEVTAEYAGGYSDIYDKMITAIAANDPTLLPNLVVGYANQTAKYELSDALVDMDEFVDSPKWGLTDAEKADFFQGIFESDVSPQFGDGHFRLGFPPNRSMEMLYYNIDWLNELGYDAPPKTWAEFEEMACAATDPANGTVGYEISTDASRFASMVFSRHGTYFAADGSAFDFQNPTVKETMTYIKDLYDKGCATLIAESYGDQTDFGNYKTLFTIGSSSGIPYYDSAVKSGEQGEFQWDIAPLPYMDGGTEPVMNVYGASVSVPKTTPEQELAAWLFAKWMTEPEQQARWVKISGYFPTRQSTADELADYFDANPFFKNAYDLLQYGTFEAQWCACYEDVRRTMEDSYNEILDGANIDDTLAQLEADANASLAENTPGGVVVQPSGNDLLDEVTAAGKLVVSTDPNYAPQSFLNDSGELDGFDIDVSKEVAKRLGVDIEFTTPDWDMITGGSWGSRWDLSIGSMTITEARSEVLWFTDPYYYTPASFAVHKDNTTITSVADLTGKTVGLGTATTYESYLDGSLSMMGGQIMYEPPSGVTLKPYSTDAEAIQDLALGDGVRLDAVMSAQQTIQNAIDQGVPLKYVGTPAFYEPLAFALDKSRGPSDQMLAKLDDIVAAMHEDGTLTDLSMKWYGVDLTTVTEAGAGPAPSGEVLYSYEAPSCDYGGEFLKMEAVDDMTVRFTLCAPDVAFPSKVAFSAFPINSSDYLESTGGSGMLVESPIGTGPYKLKEWRRGDQIIFEKNPDYWGTPAIADTLVFRWSTEGAQRLVELQSGNVDGIDNPSPDDFATVEGDSNLTLYPREALNIFYLGMNNWYPPFDNEKVRQAVAMGIDRQRIVDNFYPGGSTVASHFTPCAIPGGCEGEEWYAFDPEAAKALLAEAGFPDGFSTRISYRDVVRSYLPEPALVAQDIQAQLKNNLNIDAEIVVMESGEFIDASDAGELEGFHLLGWGADYPDQTNFLDFHFGQGASDQFGDGFPDLWDVLNQAASLTDQSARNTLYADANSLIKQHVPMIPIAHGGSATAFRADVEGAHASPLGNEYFAVMNPGGRDSLIWMQNAEPIGLYCPDETDGESLRACEQVNESLLAYEVGATAVQPALAESYEANSDLTVWTFHLRPNVTFHDGSALDSMDVVMSYVVQWDAQHPLHVGRDGSFTYFAALFGAFLNAPE
jgi:peptide/nickel transport system substrate-binding protein